MQESHYKSGNDQYMVPGFSFPILQHTADSLICIILNGDETARSKRIVITQ